MTITITITIIIIFEFESRYYIDRSIGRTELASTILIVRIEQVEVSILEKFGMGDDMVVSSFSLGIDLIFDIQNLNRLFYFCQLYRDRGPQRFRLSFDKS